MSLKNRVGLIAMVLVCLFNTKANADNDFVRNFGALKGLIDKVQTSAAAANANANAGQVSSQIGNLVPGRAGIANATDYCDTIKKSPLVQEYVRTLSKAVKTKVTTFDSETRQLMRKKLDSEGTELHDWVRASPWPTGETVKQDGGMFGRYIAAWASLCAAKNYDNDLFLFFARDLNSAEAVDVLRQKAKDALDTYGATQKVTKLGPDGTPITSVVTSREPLSFDLSKEVSRFSLQESYWVTMSAFALINGTTALESAAKGRPDELSTQIDQAIASHEKDEALAATAKKEKESAEAKRIATLEREQAQKEAVKNSPNGLLYQAYQAMQLLQTCSDVRQGYAAIYISDDELSDAKQKMRRIETTLKPRITGETTDQIWNRATTENANYIRGVKTATYANGRNYCDLFKRDMAGVSEKVFGKEALKRSF